MPLAVVDRNQKEFLIHDLPSNPGEVTLPEFSLAMGRGKIDFRDYQHQQVE